MVAPLAAGRLVGGLFVGRQLRTGLFGAGLVLLVLIDIEARAAGAGEWAEGVAEHRIEIEGGALSQLVEVLLQPQVGPAAALAIEARDEVPLGVELARGGELFNLLLGMDQMQAHGAVALHLQSFGVDQLLQQLNAAQLLDQAGIEGDLVNAVDDVPGAIWQLLAHQRIDLNDHQVLAVHVVDQRKQRRIATVAAVPVGLAVDLHRWEHERQAGRGHHRIHRDIGL